RLQVEDDARGDHHRVDGRVGGRAVAALAVHGDVHGVHVGTQETVGVGNVADGLARVAVQAQAIIRPWEAFEQAVLDHAPGPAADLLGGLADEDERALPAVLQRHQYA